MKKERGRSQGFDLHFWLLNFLDFASAGFCGVKSALVSPAKELPMAVYTGQVTIPQQHSSI
ncbi:MAG: hypothetical protein O3C43_14445 [Verrucomicrobia bacterium]|nr:hypothetical protein [Verrucomicrobiota bacterium]MDA1067689.1 hypothetical protein [Verrucomicrobiota bacterium]